MVQLDVDLKSGAQSPIAARELAPYGLHVQPGDEVTVTITAHRFTDPWWRATVTEGTRD